MNTANKKVEKIEKVEQKITVVKKFGQMSDQNIKEVSKTIVEPLKVIKQDTQLDIDVQKIKKCMSDVSKNYVYIGFYLSEIKERKLYSQVNEKDIYTFAEKHLNICKTTTKNLIRLYEVFGTNSTIKAGFEEYGYSQLVELSAIDKKYWDKVTPKTTIKQLRAIKLKEQHDKETDEVVEKVSKPKAKKETKEEFLERYFAVVLPKLQDLAFAGSSTVDLNKVINILSDEKELMLLGV